MYTYISSICMFLFTSHLHDILVHLFSAGLSWMASACALARTQPVARGPLAATM